MTKPSLDLNEFNGYGSILYKWLGTFWTRLYRDREFLTGLGNSRSIAAAQTYLDLLQRLSLMDRKGNAVQMRKRWRPLVVKLNERNTGKAVALCFDTDQARFDSSDLNFDSCFVGPGYVSYPVEDISSVDTCIVDDIVNPTKILVAGSDFVYRDGTVVMKLADDPFSNGNFAMTDDETEAVLWACDANLESDLVYRGIGYALDIKTNSTDESKTVMNAVWDALSAGLTRSTLGSLLSAIYGLPCCINVSETVEIINDDGLIVTNSNVYITDPDFRILNTGDKVYRGDAMDGRLKIFSHPFQDSAELRIHVPALQLPVTMLPSGMSGPVHLHWDLTPVYDIGEDSSGHDRIRFKFSNIADDDNLFWDRFNLNCKVTGTTGNSCFDGYINDIVFDGETNIIGRISPLKWYLEQMAGPGTIVVWVKPAAIFKYDIRLSDLIPAQVRLIIIEAAKAKEDEYESGEEDFETHTPAVVDDISIQASDSIVAMRWIYRS